MQGDESKFSAPEGVEELQQDAARRTRMFLEGTNDARATVAAIRARFGGAR